MERLVPIKTTDCHGCTHEYEEEPDACSDCFDVTTQGERAVREHYRPANPAARLCPTCASRLVLQDGRLVCRNCRYDGNGEKAVQ